MSQNTMQIVIQAKDLASREFQKLQRSIQKVQKEAKSVGKDAKSAGADFEAMGNSAAMAAAAIVGMGAAAVQMANMGEAVRNTTNRFEDLAGGAQEALASLERMRTITRYIADDQSLMQGASDLLLMGIAGTTREAEQIIELAVGLKRSTDTVADAINNFSIMLGNQAYLRLDSFGISAGRTRLRVEELLASGEALTREDAFRMAVLEIGADTMDRTIDSIDRTSTAFSRLKSDMQNFAAETGELMFNWANDISSTLELATTDRGSQRFEDIVANYNRTAQRAILENGRTMTQAQREMLQTILDFGPEAIGTGIAIPTVEPWNQWLLSFENAQGLTKRQIDELKPLMAEYFNIPEAALRQLDFDEIERLLLRTISPDYKVALAAQEIALAERNQQIAEANAQLQRDLFSDVSAFRANERIFQNVLEEYGETDIFGKITSFDSAGVNNLLAYIETIDMYYQRIAENSDQLSKEDFDNITQLYNDSRKTAQEALRVEEAFKRISLVDVLGGAPTRLQSDVIGLLSSVLPDEVADNVEEKALRMVGATSEVSELIEDHLAPAFERAGNVLSEQDLAWNISEVNYVLEDLARGAIDSATAVERLETILNRVNDSTRFRRNPDWLADAGLLNPMYGDPVFARLDDHWRDIFLTMRTGARETHTELERLFEQGQSNRGFFSPQLLQEMEAGYEQIVRYVDHISNSSLVSEESKNRMSEMLDDSAAMLQLAREGAAAVKNASLSQLMGETGDASASELARIISGGLFDPEQAEGFTRSVERLTGARTAITDYIESELAPITQALIARYGEEMGAEFAFNINQALEQGAALGLNPQTMVNQIKQNLGITMSETDAITVHIPAMATWSNIYGDTRPLDENGNPLTDEALADKIEADLNLADGTVDLNRPILYAIQGTGLTAQSLANLEGVRSDLLGVIFNDPQNPNVTLDSELEVNLPNVGIGRIMAMTGFTKQEIMQQLAAQGEDFHYDPATDNFYVSPGTFTFRPYRQVPITEADFSLSSSAIRASDVFQETFDPFANLLPNSQLLVENMENFGTVDLSATQTQLDSADTTVTSIYDTTKLLTETVWTLTINVEVNEPEYSRILEEAVGRMNRDNGGRSPGTISQGR